MMHFYGQPLAPEQVARRRAVYDAVNTYVVADNVREKIRQHIDADAVDEISQTVDTESLVLAPDGDSFQVLANFYVTATFDDAPAMPKHVGGVLELEGRIGPDNRAQIDRARPLIVRS
ncbi:hypothetical protein CCR85_13725 [Rhodothalassium salexigens]|nr:hypothetical protein [Rhodothalassium salexigens]MBK5920815.1 hypothetical protein [Rhodothalassium salexigens]